MAPRAKGIKLENGTTPAATPAVAQAGIVIHRGLRCNVVSYAASPDGDLVITVRMGDHTNETVKPASSKNGARPTVTRNLLSSFSDKEGKMPLRGLAAKYGDSDDPMLYIGINRTARQASEDEWKRILAADDSGRRGDVPVGTLAGAL